MAIHSENDLPLFAHRQSYPASCGYKTSGASQEAAELMERTGADNVWRVRCEQLYDLRDDWTATEGIQHYVDKLGLPEIDVDKSLRPRFAQLCASKFLYKSKERRGEKKIKPHIYRKA